LAAEPTKESAWPVPLAALQLGWRSFGGPIAHLGYFERRDVQFVELQWTPFSIAAYLGAVRAAGGRAAPGAGIAVFR
jgi:hypothetical protein